MLTLKPGKKYDMPAFEESIYPAESHVDSVHAYTTVFETTQEAIENLLPRHLAYAGDNSVAVNRLRYRGCDYLGGRGYEEFVIGVTARYEHAGEVIVASYPVVIWVNEVPSMLSGREFLGFPKLYAEIPQLTEEGDRIGFSASEYGNKFLDGHVRLTKKCSDSTLAKIQAAANPYSFGWKYIAGPDGTVDADYATLFRMEWQYKEAWHAEGEVNFIVGTPRELPLSGPSVRALAALPVVARKPAFAVKATATIYRDAIRRLESMTGRCA